MWWTEVSCVESYVYIQLLDAENCHARASYQKTITIQNKTKIFISIEINRYLWIELTFYFLILSSKIHYYINNMNTFMDTNKKENMSVKSNQVIYA